jgi:hypothetical protein
MDENQALLHDVFVFELGGGVRGGRWRRLRSPVFQVCVCVCATLHAVRHL